MSANYSDIRAAIRVLIDTVGREANDLYLHGEDVKRHGVVPQPFTDARGQLSYAVENLEKAEANLSIAAECLEAPNTASSKPGESKFDRFCEGGKKSCEWCVGSCGIEEAEART